MLIQLFPGQVPKFWEVIKFAAIQSDGVKEKDIEVYSYNLLNDLLSSKKQCFIVQQENQISVVILTEFRYDISLNKKYFYFNNLYAFAKNDISFWQIVLSDLHKIAKKNDCNEIVGESGIPRMQEILDFLNVPCVSRKYVYTLGKEA